MAKKWSFLSNANNQGAGKIEIDLSEDSLGVYNKEGKLIFGQCGIVHGCEGFETPTGDFKAGDWQFDKTSSKYGPVPWSKDKTNPYGPWFLPINDLKGNYTTYGIHGTAGPDWNPFVKPPFFLGGFFDKFDSCSHGCVRLSNPNITELHNLIPNSRGLPIHISQ